jgi:hypothetical protein
VLLELAKTHDVVLFTQKGPIRVSGANNVSLQVFRVFALHNASKFSDNYMQYQGTLSGSVGHISFHSGGFIFLRFSL